MHFAIKGSGARFANDIRGTRFINNADLIGCNYTFKLKANRNIKPNQEILTNCKCGCIN